MKKSILLAVTTCMAIAVLLYLAGAFIAADWDIRNWETAGRKTLAFTWLAGSLAAGMALVQCHADD